MRFCVRILPALLLLSLICSLAFPPQGFADKKAPRSTVLRQGDFVVKQLVAPDFDRLPLERKLFAYYIARAVDAGRDIFWTQASREGLAIRDLVEKMWLHGDYFSPSEKASLEEYMFLLYANHAHYDDYRNEKFVPEGLTREAFLKMAASAEFQAIRAGKKKPGIVTEATRLADEIFDPEFKKTYQAREAADIVGESNSNFYGPGMTTEKLNALPDEARTHFLSYPEVDWNGKVNLAIQRIGGRFGKELAAIAHELTQASKYATAAEREILKAYIQALHSGDPRDLQKAETLWVQNKSADIDFNLGFIETYSDPMGFRGAWEGFVLMMNQDPATVERVRRIRQNAGLFEQLMPVDPRFKKEPGFTPPSAEGAFMIYAGGESGERPFLGVNLPNDTEIQATHGSKSFSTMNVSRDINEPKSDTVAAEIPFYAPKYAVLLTSIDTALIDDIQTEFHEVLGHGSGKSLPGVSDQDVKEYYNALEEGRAEIAALYHMTNPIVRDLGIVSDKMSDSDFTKFAELSIIDFFTRHLRSYYTKLTDSTTKIRQAHQWARQVMMNRLLAEGALKLGFSEKGIPQLDVVELKAVRESLGRLWGEVQEIKSTGNYDGAKALFETWGTYTDENKQWREAIKAEVESQRRPKERIYLNPRLKLVFDKTGEKITDVKLAYASAANGLSSVVSRQLEAKRQAKASLRSCEKLMLPDQPASG